MNLRVHNFKPGESLVLVKILPTHYTLTSENYYFNFCDEVLKKMNNYKERVHMQRYLGAIAVVEPYLKVDNKGSVDLKTFDNRKTLEIEELDKITRIKRLKKDA